MAFNVGSDSGEDEINANINTTQKYNVRKEELEDNPLLTLKYQD